VSEEPDAPAGRPHIQRALAVAIAVLSLLAAVNVGLGYRDHQIRQSESLRRDMVDAAREGAVNLTTIDHQQADEAVQRILDTSTGAFRDDFAERATGFIDAAKKAQSKSVGTVADAGLESVDGDVGRVLVALTVMTSNRGVPERQPRAWRMRVTVTPDDDTYKVSSVEFIG
jgi:Mce-associated membrane protein